MKAFTARTIVGITLLFGLFAPEAYAQSTPSGRSAQGGPAMLQGTRGGGADPTLQPIPLEPSGSPACCGDDWSAIPNGHLWTGYCEQADHRGCQPAAREASSEALLREPPLREFALDRFVMSLTNLLACHSRHPAAACDVGPDTVAYPPGRAEPARSPAVPRNAPRNSVQTRPVLPVQPSVAPPRRIQPQPPRHKRVPAKIVPPAVPHVHVGPPSVPRNFMTTTPRPRASPVEQTAPILRDSGTSRPSAESQQGKTAGTPRDDAPLPPNGMQRAPQAPAVPANVIPKRMLEKKPPKKKDRQVSYRLGDYFRTR